MLVIEVKDGYYWTFISTTTAEEAAAFLAERSQHVPLHTEPTGFGGPLQEHARELYFELGGVEEAIWP